MKKLAFEGFAGNDSAFSTHVTGGHAAIYLNELCVNLQPADIVANCPVLSSVITVLTCHCPPANFSTPAARRALEGAGCEEPSVSNSEVAMPMLTPAILPLIYVNTGNLRLLFPHGRSGTGSGVGTESGTTGGDGAAHDVWVTQLRALTLTPVADNPLPRIIVEKEVYRRALRAGITQQPGSEVEDRQYQLDVAGLSLSTGAVHFFCFVD